MGANYDVAQLPARLQAQELEVAAGLLQSTGLPIPDIAFLSLDLMERLDDEDFHQRVLRGVVPQVQARLLNGPRQRPQR